MSDLTCGQYDAAVEDCPEPYWHKTHRYCPVCPWTERGWQPPYADPDFQPGIVVADLDGGPDDRRCWECRVLHGAPRFRNVLWTGWLDRSDLPARLGVVDPDSGQVKR